MQNAVDSKQNSAAIFSDDAGFASHFSDFCRRTVSWDPFICGDFRAARSVLEKDPCSTVFVDLRASSATGETTGETHKLLNYMTQVAQPATSFVTLSNGFYPREHVRTASLHAVGHITLPLETQAQQTLPGLRNRFSQSCTDGRRRPLTPNLTEAGDIAIATYTPAFIDVMQKLARMAKHDVTLLLVGETGTGKTTLAKLIHRLSRRSEAPFHTVGCGALSRDLIESELFGHVRGAFTGAERNKIGRFEAAGRGTLLIDEIDLLGLKEQANLLRVIETGEYEMVGSTETRTSNARLIVASNIDLESLIQRKRFRTDLYYRLNTLEFSLPPLRERPLDIVPMAIGFIDQFCDLHAIPIDRVQLEFLETLQRHTWPGNIRELKNQIERAVLFSEEGELKTCDLSSSVRGCQSEEPHGHAELSQNRQPTSLAERVASNEQHILLDALRSNDNSRTETARMLGISRVGLYKKMRKYGMLEEKKR